MCLGGLEVHVVFCNVCGLGWTVVMVLGNHKAQGSVPVWSSRAGQRYLLLFPVGLSLDVAVLDDISSS